MVLNKFWKPGWVLDERVSILENQLAEQNQHEPDLQAESNELGQP